MSNRFDDQPVYRSGMNANIDMGLRTYMMNVYNYMAIGLGITGLIAYLVSTQMEIMMALHGTALKWVVLLAPLGMVFYLSARMRSLSASTAQTLFFVYAGLMGLSLSSVFLVFTGESITRVFFIAASMFAATSLYGYTTKRDLSGMGSFLFMGLIGLIIASVVNIFLESSAVQMAVSYLGVLIFTGLTAYDTQRIKEIYREYDNANTLTKKAIFGALTLYLDFINMFIFLLQILGDRKN